jgi:hypothetical protein
MRKSIRRAVQASAGIACAAGILVAGSGVANAQPGAANLSQGSQGFGVWCVQFGADLFFDAYGYSYDDTAQDGGFGPDTARAVWDFQSLNGLQTDSVVGPQTGGVLYVYIKNMAPNTLSPWGIPAYQCYSQLPTNY